MHGCTDNIYLHINNERESLSVISNSLPPLVLYSPWNSLTRILEWVAFPFSRGSSQPRDWTQVSHSEGNSLPTELSGKPY